MWKLINMLLNVSHSGIKIILLCTERLQISIHCAMKIPMTTLI